MNKDFAIGFLAAAIDGEGSFMLQPAVDVRVLKKGRRSLSIRACMEIENTSEEFIDKVEEALRVVVVGSFRLYRNFKQYDKHSYWKRYGFIPLANTVLGGGKNYYRLTVCGRDDLKRLIDVLRDELTVKKEAVAIIEEFFVHVADTKQYKATRDDLELCQKLFELQGRRRKPYPMAKYLACLTGDWQAYRAAVDEPTPCQAEGNDAGGTSEGVEASR